MAGVPLPALIQFGGWTEDWSALHIVRYLYSCNDLPITFRNQYLTNYKEFAPAAIRFS
jgi:hypothetical protein